MKRDRAALILFRELEDKSELELAIVTITAHTIKVVGVSQYVDLRTENGDTFATLTFPSWVKVRTVER